MCHKGGDWSSITGCNVWKHRLNKHIIWSGSWISSTGSWSVAGAQHKMRHWAEWIFAGQTGSIGMSRTFLSLVSRAGVTSQSEDAPAALLTIAWHWTQQDQATWAPPELLTKVWLQAGFFKAFESLCDWDPRPPSPSGHALHTLGTVYMHVASSLCFKEAVWARFCVKLKPKR